MTLVLGSGVQAKTMDSSSPVLNFYIGCVSPCCSEMNYLTLILKGDSPLFVAADAGPREETQETHHLRPLSGE